MIPQKDLHTIRKKHGIQPLQDLTLDAIRRAVRKSGSVRSAAPLLGVTVVTIHKRMRAGYSDGNKPLCALIVDDRNKHLNEYDWSKCDAARKPQ